MIILKIQCDYSKRVTKFASFFKFTLLLLREKLKVIRVLKKKDK